MDAACHLIKMQVVYELDMRKASDAPSAWATLHSRTQKGSKGGGSSSTFLCEGLEPGAVGFRVPTGWDGMAH